MLRVGQTVRILPNTEEGWAESYGQVVRIQPKGMLLVDSFDLGLVEVHVTDVEEKDSVYDTRLH